MKRKLETPESYHLAERHIYGSSRVGMITEKVEFEYVYGNQPSEALIETLSFEETVNFELNYTIGEKQYELSNHLGNVLAVISDWKVPVISGASVISYTSIVISSQDYSPFGVTLEGRSWSAGYRYGFNGCETETSTSYLVFKKRLNNPQLGRWTGIDPDNQLILSPYSSSVNNPILLKDVDGGWIPGVTASGQLYLKREDGDTYESLQKFFGYPQNENRWIMPADLAKQKPSALIWVNKTNNFAQAFQYAYSSSHSGEFFDNREPSERESRGYDHSNAKEFDNYNCYHFAINGAWEKPIYNKSGSYGNFIMLPEEAERVLESRFELSKEKDAIVGETIVAMNFSGGVAQHFAVFAGRDKNGTMYFMEKAGSTIAPKILTKEQLGGGMGYTDLKFYNEKK
jgi:RHS repeat-associated protein